MSKVIKHKMKVVEKLEPYTVLVKCDFCEKKVIKDRYSNLILDSGYGSKFDSLEVTFQICDNCLSNLLSPKKRI